MKKSERKTEISKRAYEYAKSGEHGNWLSIEHTLCFIDGFSEARTELDNQYIRQELDSLCKTATSAEESSRRRDFSRWIDWLVSEIGPELSKQSLNLRRSTSEDCLLVSGPNYSIRIRRCFNSRKLEYEKAVYSQTGTCCRFHFKPVPSDKDFDAMILQDVVGMIVGMADTASTMVTKMWTSKKGNA